MVFDAIVIGVGAAGMFCAGVLAIGMGCTARVTRPACAIMPRFINQGHAVS